MPAPSLSSLASLDGFSEIGFGGGVDMRPTLLRVLTDLYVQKPTHTPDEETHYTELALRLLEAVDITARVAVATRLARHTAPPERVVHYLIKDLPEVVAALRPHDQAAPAQSEHPVAPPVAETAALLRPTATDQDLPDIQDLPNIQDLSNIQDLPDVQDPPNIADEPERRLPAAATIVDANVADELNDMFFAADATERRLILLNLHIVVPPPAERVAVDEDASIGRRLEAAALAHNREEFAQTLVRALQVSRTQAHRILRDDLGEPIVIAAKVLAVPRDRLYRILLFVNTSVGHSVERVHGLAELYDAMTMDAAAVMVAIWQAMPQDERLADKQQTLRRIAESGLRARTVGAEVQSPVVPQTAERRSAS